jgi:hypothetical protein
VSEPPTLLIPEIDEDGTFVDTRNADFDSHPETLNDMHAPSSKTADGYAERLCNGFSLRRPLGLRRYAQGIVVVGLVSGLTFVGYQQWRIAESIRTSMGELSDAKPSLPNREAPSFPERAPLGRDSASDSKPMSQETREARMDRLESIGAALIRANDFEAALHHYRALAQAIPEESVFRDLVFVLRSKLRCERSLSLTHAGCP